MKTSNFVSALLAATILSMMLPMAFAADFNLAFTGPDLTKPCFSEGQGWGYAISPAGFSERNRQIFYSCCAGLKKISNNLQPELDGECAPALGYSSVICAKCGNGICGAGENKCNCPSDCKPTQSCYREGEGLIGYVTSDTPILSCCSGLTRVNDASLSGSGCAAVEGFICTKCGDGICGVSENICNCPSDCKENCVKEGGSVPIVPNAPKCCAGLTGIGCNTPDSSGNCNQNCVGASVCAKCGDGICGIGENKCNCPQDCSAIQECAGVGERFSIVYREYPQKCCPGLTEWLNGMDTRRVVDGRCVETGLVSGSPIGTCINCGNGICESIETICNCPSDCKYNAAPMCSRNLNPADCKRAGGFSLCTNSWCTCQCFSAPKTSFSLAFN
jgi:hypothetical protein